MRHLDAGMHWGCAGRGSKWVLESDRGKPCNRVHAAGPLSCDSPELRLAFKGTGRS